MQDSELISWLVNAGTPSIRYLTQVNLAGCLENDPKVIAARQAIMTEGPAPAVLSLQSEKGNWQGERSYYTPKYVSTHWNLMLLTELCVDSADDRFQKGVEYMLDATKAELGEQLGAHLFKWSCFWGNLLRYSLRGGTLDDARIEKIVDYLAADLQDGPCRCPANGGYACAWGVVRSLWGLAAIPLGQRSPGFNRAINLGVKFLLETFQLAEATYPTSPVRRGVSPLWFRLNFPLFYQVDILFTLRVMDELNQLEHPRARRALSWLAQRRGSDGRWSGSSPFRRRTWSELGDRQETDRRVSLHASQILKRAGGSE